MVYKYVRNTSNEQMGETMAIFHPNPKDIYSGKIGRHIEGYSQPSYTSVCELLEEGEFLYAYYEISFGPTAYTEPLIYKAPEEKAVYIPNQLSFDGLNGGILNYDYSSHVFFALKEEDHEVARRRSIG